ncbi:Hsp70 family protein [Dactylosporangium sp. CS-047395]|uniref:Hsp70 family protein n=1 Tax=Dactylosporangium sp. CS-047395 TaxID=3239936 RepID=UPI003D913792
MDARGYRLGVDFGTSNTVAMLAWPDGHVRPLLFDGSPTLPSSVYADAQQGLLTGRDAMHAARISPERYEPNPKRRIDEPAVLLGDHEISTVDLIAAVLVRVAGEARRVSGGALGPATITCPAAWAQTRRGVLIAAAERAGLGRVTLVPEPVAAAQVFLSIAGQVGPGSAFVVYDLGAGTFDASVVRHGNGTFEVLSAEGLSTSGGLDIDAAIVGYLGAVHAGRDPQAWQRLTHPATSADRRANRLLWDDVRNAKEMLSRTSSTMIHVPTFETDAPLGRDQFEELARPILTATVTSTRAAIAAAGLNRAEVKGVFLVGGGSRIPLVATLLHQALGVAPTVVEQPELVVAQGAVGASEQAVVPAVLRPTSARASVPSTPAAPTSPSAPPSAAQMSAPPIYTSPPTNPVPASQISAPPTSSPVSTPPVSTPPLYGSPTGPTSGAAAYAPPQTATPATYGQPATPSYAPTSGSPTYPPPNAATPKPPAFAAPAAPPPSGPPGIGGRPMAPSYAAPEPPARKKRTGTLVAAAVVVLLVLAGGAYGVSKLLGDKTDNNGGGGDTGSDTGSDTSQVQADIERTNVDWYTKADDYDEKAGTTVGYNCPAKGEIGTVYGTGIYTTDSSVCTAAVHDGRITLEDGGRIIIKIVQGPDSYESTYQHGINTTAYGPWPWAFQIVG